LTGISPDAKLNRFVRDNLNPHAATSPHKAFEPEGARRIARKLEIIRRPMIL
jgi:hypothetical protein